MDSSHRSDRSLSDSSSGSSNSYVDVEMASSFDLLSYNRNVKTASGYPAAETCSSRTKTLVLISLITSVLCLLSIGALSYWLFLSSDSPFSLLRRGEARPEVCVPCLQVSPDPLDSSSGSAMWEELTVKYDEDNDTEICCAAGAEQFAALFKLILQRQEEVQKLAEYLEASGETEETKEEFPVAQQITGAKAPVSAHLVFKPSRQRDSGDDDSSVQQWKSPAESPLSHLLPGIKFQRHTRLLVQTPGLYYVYCLLLFNPPAGPRSADEPSDVAASQRVTSAYVRRYSILRPASPTFLLKLRHTQSDVNEDRHSAYVGGVFRLHRGDSLFVQASRPDLISHDDQASFFGLFKLGP